MTFLVELKVKQPEVRAAMAHAPLSKSEMRPAFTERGCVEDQPQRRLFVWRVKLPPRMNGRCSVTLRICPIGMGVPQKMTSQI
jgi:hypothetical protein